ncbi:MAG: HpcH/HpaI aldolase/citrate lyase family protein [Lautropia sp.]
METKALALKRALAAGCPQFGLVCAIPSFLTIEAIASSGFAFFLLDAEHQPTNPSIVHTQLLALANSPTGAIVKLPGLDATAIRQYLDLGADGLMAPNIETREDARQLVSLTRYPPRGVRGIAGTVRATRFTRDKSYPRTAEDHFVTVALIESRKGLDNLEAIASVDGIDIVFFGPGDLAAEMGHTGQASHPNVVAALESGVGRVQAAGKIAGLLAAEADIDRYHAHGARMFIAGAELGLFVQAADGLASRLSSKYALAAARA